MICAIHPSHLLLLPDSSQIGSQSIDWSLFIPHRWPGWILRGVQSRASAACTTLLPTTYCCRRCWPTACGRTGSWTTGTLAIPRRRFPRWIARHEKSRSGTGSSCWVVTSRLQLLGSFQPAHNVGLAGNIVTQHPSVSFSCQFIRAHMHGNIFDFTAARMHIHVGDAYPPLL